MVNTIAKRITACLLCILLTAVLLMPALADASKDTEEPRVVRVGYVNVKTYEEGGEGEYKRGAGYEYLQRISYATGWKYEYVHASFKECLEMLMRGEIDLMGNVSYTPERAEHILYADIPQGLDNYWLFTSAAHPELLQGDISALNGCTIGVTDGTVQETILNEWLAAKNIDAAVVGCQGYDDLMARLDRGELDAIATSDLSLSYHYQGITHIGISEYYFAVAANQPELLQELNAALHEIQDADENFNGKLASKYEYMMASNMILVEEEKQWLADHGNTIRLGVLDNYMPFAGVENGKTTGIITALVDCLEQDYGIDVTVTPYADYAALKSALHAEEIDLAGPFISDYYFAEQNGLVVTEGILRSTPVVLFRGNDYASAIKTVAAPEQSVMTPGMARILFPDAEIIPCKTPLDCMQAVVDGKACSMVIPSARINILRTNPMIKYLSIAELSEKLEICMLTTRSNRRAATILNKVISHASASLDGVVYAQSMESGLHLEDVVRKYFWQILMFLGVITVALSVLSYMLVRNKRKLVNALSDAKAASAAKTNFLFNMSHDIRTPMNAMMGFRDLLEKHQDDPVKRQDYLDKIKAADEVLLSIINNVLEMTRIEKGTLELDEIAGGVDQFCDGISSMFIEMMVEKNIRFTTRANVEHGFVFCDITKTREIFINLLSNAHKYTQPGGSVEMAVEEIPSGREGYATFRTTVKDTGIGMSESFLPHIFDEFARENNTTDARIEGTGLGMPIVRRLVDFLGGTIEVDSRKGVGTTVTITMTHRIATQEDCAAQVDKAIDPGLFAGKRILLAEDNELNAEIAIEILQEAGFTVDHAEDGQICCDMLEKAAPGYYDLIMMDIQMPHLNGYEAAVAIRRMNDPVKAAIPIIAMTANAFEEDKREAFRCGMNGHLAKPINVKDVLRQLSATLKTMGQ
ncbi:MAG: transporter substrate-binding domain-containing protein [Clostridia bacterium]|nr:transporter substrate-binding domain-containing protein [Clostridia bacterium]